MLSCLASAERVAATDGVRPNVLVIVTDDQRPGTFAVMPRTREWFKHGGTTYSRAFVTTPLCCPARASIFTGLYAHNHGVTANSSARSFPHDVSVQRYLSDAGYTTAIIGKYFNGMPLSENPPHFDHWAIGGRRYWDADFNVDGTVQPFAGYATSALAGLAVDFLHAAEADDSKPWFLYVAPKAPHLPALPEEKYADATVPPWRPSAAVTEADRSDKPPWVRATRVSRARVRALRADQLRTLMSVDGVVADVASALESLGEDSETLAFYLSDNGFLWGEHGLIRKAAPYPGSTKVPLVMRWPGHVAARVRDRRFASIADVAPTILDAADVAPPAPMDGTSLLAPSERDEAFTEFFSTRDFARVPQWASLTTRRFQYVEYYSDDRSRVVFREYYRLWHDPEQLTNILADGDATNDPGTRSLHRRLAAYATCSALSCP